MDYNVKGAVSQKKIQTVIFTVFFFLAGCVMYEQYDYQTNHDSISYIVFPALLIFDYFIMLLSLLRNMNLYFENPYWNVPGTC